MRIPVLALSLWVSGSAVWADTAQNRIQDAATVFTEIMSTPDKSIPQDLLAKASCVVVVPGLKKAALGVGGQYGRGFVTCRQAGAQAWSDPAAIRVEGGSVGFQIGGSDTDVVMLVMNKSGMDKLMKSKFTLGADASVAAGPVGRTASASTDATMNSEILAWSRSKGAFAGIALSGATLRPDKDENKELYGRSMDTREVLTGNLPKSPATAPLMTALNQYAGAGSSADRTSDADRQMDQNPSDKTNPTTINPDNTRDRTTRPDRNKPDDSANPPDRTSPDTTNPH